MPPAPRRRVSRPAGATTAAPVATTEERDAPSPPPQNFDVEDESAAAGAPSPDADAAVADLFSTVLRWDFDALVARGGAAEVAGSDDPRERLQLQSLPLTFKDANVSDSFGRVKGDIDGWKREAFGFASPTVDFFSISQHLEKTRPPPKTQRTTK